MKTPNRKTPSGAHGTARPTTRATIVEQLDMFERESEWQTDIVNRLVKSRDFIRGFGLPTPGIDRSIDEMCRRVSHLVDEYLRWLERNEVREAVEAILEERRTAVKTRCRI